MNIQTAVNQNWLAEENYKMYYQFINSLVVGSGVSILSPYNGNVTKSVVTSIDGEEMLLENGMTFVNGTENKNGGYKFHKILSDKQLSQLGK